MDLSDEYAAVCYRYRSALQVTKMEQKKLCRCIHKGSDPPHLLLLLRTLSAYTAACQSLPGGVGRGALWGIMNTTYLNMRLLYFLVLILAIQLFVPFWILGV